MAAEKRTRAKRFAQAIADCSDEQYEIKPLTEWRKVNRANGWGNYDDLLGIMREMRDAGRKWPSARWSTA